MCPLEVIVLSRFLDVLVDIDVFVDEGIFVRLDTIHLESTSSYPSMDDIVLKKLS